MSLSFNENTVTADQFLLKKASTMCISGPSRSGKTTFIKKLLINLEHMYPDGDTPHNILYCYSIEQPMYLEMKEIIPNITFHKGLPSRDTIEGLGNEDHNLVVLDDLITRLQKSEDILEMFLLGSHHLNISVFYLTQNIFHQGKYSRTITLNTQYLTLFKTPRDSSQIKYLARQVFPSTPHALSEAYYDATESQDFGYLFLDLSQQCKESLRMRSHITPDHYTIVYTPIR